MNIRLPIKLKPGGQKRGAKEEYIDSLRVFAEDMKKMQAEVGFNMSARGWCYVLEQFGLDKGDFETGQGWIRKCRVRGFLRPGFILEDESHEVEGQSDEKQSVENYVEGQYDIWQDAEKDFRGSWMFYNGVSFWEGQDRFIQLLVEKSDLKSLFRGICERYRMPAGNLHGFGSMEQKAVMARNFQLAEREGKEPVLFACTDFDPPGLCISDLLKGDFEEFSTFTGWDPKSLKVERIGLGYNFIQDNHLNWIENLKSASGKDMTSATHETWIKNKYHIHEYVAQYGARKCEANAIVVAPKLGRKMLQDAIDKWLGKNAFDDYEEHLEVEQGRAKQLIKDKLNDEGEEEY
ncbi:hypothetical protein ES705_41360 [subsurface metagenome]